MAFNFEIEYTSRSLVGKGASRRLRREKDMIPAIVYGAEKAPENIMVEQRVMRKALENEAVYSHILTLTSNGSKEQVVLKDIQRHPFKPTLQHIDFQRVSANKPIIMHVPIHFLNEAECPGVEDGGVISHSMIELEIKCLPKDLPEFINIDMKNVKLDDVIHLSDVTLPQGVELTTDIKENDAPVVSVHVPKRVSEEDSAEEASDSEDGDSEQADSDKNPEADK